MRTIAIPFLGWAAPDKLARPAKRRAVLRLLLAMLDRLVPPRVPARDPEPPPEWFRYPPI